MRDWLSKEGQGRQVLEWVSCRVVWAHRWVTAKVSRTSGSKGQWDRDGKACPEIQHCFLWKLVSQSTLMNVQRLMYKGDHCHAGYSGRK